MNTLSHLRLQETKARLRQRAGLIAAVRKYFDNNGFLEVDTPVLIPAPAPEEYIEGIPAADGFLRTSPELQMKIMLCAISDDTDGYNKIYQLGPCFRHGEHGRRHRSEFTMLEWYEAEIDYMQLAEFTTGLLRFVSQELNGVERLEYQGEIIDLSLPPQVITVRAAFKKYAGLELEEIAKNPDLDFDEIMVSQVEPNLGRGRISYLIDYPADRAALARLKPGQPDVAERWELYIAGLELANAYRELTDPVEQRQRFEQACEERSKHGLISYPVADDFFQALDCGMPQCSGAALGVDRLVMIFTDSSDIAQIRTF